MARREIFKRLGPNGLDAQQRAQLNLKVDDTIGHLEYMEWKEKFEVKERKLFADLAKQSSSAPVRPSIYGFYDCLQICAPASGRSA